MLSVSRNGDQEKEIRVKRSVVKSAMVSSIIPVKSKRSCCSLNLVTVSPADSF